MEKQTIQSLLKRINLNLDIFTIQKTVEFLLKDVGFIKQIQIPYQVYSALAIVSESQTLPSSSSNRPSESCKNGIKIQNVMSHLQNLSKQTFLDTMNKQLQKLKKPPQNMKKRVEDIRYSYRFFKKYQTTFVALFDDLVQKKSLKQQFCALFWMLYLYIKNTQIETENITECKTLLILLFRSIFERFICKSDFNQIFDIMESNIGDIPEISIKDHHFYQNKFLEKLDYFYKQRYSGSHINFQKLFDNYTFLNRLVDDMSNAYVKEYKEMRYYNQIDQLSFLQLKKTLTPQVFKKGFFTDSEEFEPIANRLTFQDSDEQPEQENEKFKSFQKSMPSVFENPQTPSFSALPVVKEPKISNEQLRMATKTISTQSAPKKTYTTSTSKYNTPITKKIQNEKWMDQTIKRIGIQDLIQMRSKIEEINKTEQLAESSSTSQSFNQFLKETIYQLIKQFTPKCQNYEQRYIKILSFFLANNAQIQKKAQCILSDSEDPASIERRRQRLIGIATLSCEIFNYISLSISYEFKLHCELFGLDMKVAFETFQLFEKYIIKDMPTDLAKYIQKTQKRFICNDIWENQQGFKFLCHSENNEDMIRIRNKIIQQTQNRIKEIASQARCEQKIISKTINMMKFILEKKFYLLKNNNVDQIILCCLMACLSINEKQEHQSLQELFNSYNKNIQFSFGSNQSGLKDNFGKQMKIVDYYNEVFLDQIKDMLAQSKDNIDDFLLTPVRINKQYSLSNMQNNFGRFKQKPLTMEFMFNPEKPGVFKTNYKTNFENQNMDMKEEKQQNEQDVKSPTFSVVPGLHKAYSFGPGTSSNN